MEPQLATEVACWYGPFKDCIAACTAAPEVTTLTPEEDYMIALIALDGVGNKAGDGLPRVAIMIVSKDHWYIRVAR